MINVYIYLNSAEDAGSLVEELLKEELVAHACIDKENNSMRLMDGKVVIELQYVITAQTRALLFTDIVKIVKANYMHETKVYSVPITQCNESFSEFIRQHTKTAV
jgi:uncharacterized protein involved in tolerance to divalent cations